MIINVGYKIYFALFFLILTLIFPTCNVFAIWGLRGDIGTGTESDPYYKFSAKYISQFLPANPVVVEAGAHDGEDTYQMSLIWPLGQIHAFEPDPRTYPDLKSNLMNCANVNTYPIALGAYDGVADFYLSKETAQFGIAGQSSLFPDNPNLWPWHWVEIEKQPVSVAITTLDSWAEKQGILKIDFLWIDMQGSEFQMLKASPRMLKNITFIKTEYSTKEYYKGTVLFDHLRAFLESEGFRLLDICGETHGDALFIKN